MECKACFYPVLVEAADLTGDGYVDLVGYCQEMGLFLLEHAAGRVLGGNESSGSGGQGGGGGEGGGPGRRRAAQQGGDSQMSTLLLPPQSLQVVLPHPPSALGLADIDQNGWLDLVVTTREADAPLLWVPNLGKDTSTSKLSFGSYIGSSSTSSFSLPSSSLHSHHFLWRSPFENHHLPVPLHFLSLFFFLLFSFSFSSSLFRCSGRWTHKSLSFVPAPKEKHQLGPCTCTLFSAGHVSTPNNARGDPIR